MPLVLPTGTELRIQRMDDALADGAPGIDADALVASSRALRAQGALERLGRKLTRSRCTLVAILGPEAERVHDELDDFLIGDGTETKPLPTTTWHSNSADEDAADILNMVEHWVLYSDGGHGPRTILVLLALASAPSNVRELLHLLDSDLQGIVLVDPE